MIHKESELFRNNLGKKCCCKSLESMQELILRPKAAIAVLIPAFEEDYQAVTNDIKAKISDTTLTYMLKKKVIKSPIAQAYRAAHSDPANRRSISTINTVQNVNCKFIELCEALNENI